MATQIILSTTDQPIALTNNNNNSSIKRLLVS